MISIVVCSIDSTKLAVLKKSVESTIGVAFEWLIADNQKTGKGICQVYNEQALKARYPFLLFVHEDVSFDIENWGKNVLSYFEENPVLGLVGVAGATAKSLSFSGWYTGDPRFDRYRLVHSSTSRREELDQLPSSENIVFPVVCLDGVFLFCRKTVWEHIRFDDRTILGFHFYDLDFSMRVAKKFDVGVISSIGLVHHTSTGGDYGSVWVQEAIRFHGHWQKSLPLCLNNLPVAELQIQKVWLDRLKDEKVSFFAKCNWVLRQRQLLKPTLVYSIIKFFLYFPLRLRYVHRYLRARFSE